MTLLQPSTDTAHCSPVVQLSRAVAAGTFTQLIQSTGYGFLLFAQDFSTFAQTLPIPKLLKFKNTFKNRWKKTYSIWNCCYFWIASVNVRQRCICMSRKYKNSEGLLRWSGGGGGLGRDEVSFSCSTLNRLSMPVMWPLHWTRPDLVVCLSFHSESLWWLTDVMV